VTRTFFNQKAAVWDETIAEQDGSKLAQMARRLNIESGTTVLDVGSGTGIFLPFLLSQVGLSGRVFALDPAEEMLKKSRAKCFAEQIYYLHADVTSIPVRDIVFDTVVCHSCFPHFQDKAIACVEMSRVTRAGGRVLICHTSSRTEINQLHHQIAAVANDLIPDEDTMRSLLSRAGFTGIEIDDGRESYLVSAQKPGKTGGSDDCPM